MRNIICVPQSGKGGACCQGPARLGAEFESGRSCSCDLGNQKLLALMRSIMRDPDILVATPGRLIDHLHNTPNFSLQNVEVLVLDEADRMFDMGFEDDVKFIIQRCPSHLSGRLTAMFSATWPREVRFLASEFLQDPVHVNVVWSCLLQVCMQMQSSGYQSHAERVGDTTSV